MDTPFVDAEPTIFVVDEDPILLCAAKAIGSRMAFHIEHCPSGEDLLTTCDPTQPGCILLDPAAPNCDGLALLDQIIIEKDIPLPVVVVSECREIPMVVEAMRRGALDYVLKPCDDERLSEVIGKALQWDSANRRSLVQAAKVRRRLRDLNEGENEVLSRMVGGLSNRQTAEELKVSVRTVEDRRAKVMKKLHARSIAELVHLLATAHFVRRTGKMA